MKQKSENTPVATAVATTINTDGRNVKPEAQKELRRRCIVLFKKGVKQADIARSLVLTPQWVSKTVKVFLSDGETAAIEGKKRGVKPETAEKMRILTSDEEKRLKGWIIDKNPRQLCFDFGLWTARAVNELISREFKKDIAIRTVRNYLRAWGMTPQRPKKKAIQQNDAAVKDWVETQYPAIVKRAKEENATIFWEDETAVQQDTNWVRGYAPRGQTPTIEHDRKSCYGAPVMISAVNNQGLSYFLFQKTAVTRVGFIRFLHRLIADNSAKGRKLFVICDNVKFHHAKLVQAWCEKHSEEIELFFLPAYSPERNPDEFINRGLKTELRMKSAKNHEETLELAKTITARFKTEMTAILKCFETPCTEYAKAI